MKKISKIRLIGIQEIDIKETGENKIFKAIKAHNFPELKDNMNIMIQTAYNHPQSLVISVFYLTLFSSSVLPINKVKIP